MTLIDAFQAEKDYAILKAREGSILHFTQLTFPDYEINWHHKVLARYLNKFLKKEIRRLMVFMPPRHGKSELTSRRLPALIHGMYPNDEILAMCYNNTLASDMTIDCQRIMDTKQYKEIFPTIGIVPEGKKSQYARNANEHEIIPYQDPVDRLWNYYRGSYRSAGVGGTFTGRGGHWILIDDPIKNREDADSPAFRESLWKFYSSTVRTRLEGEGSICLTMTRWHDDDLAGRLLKLAKTNKEADQWTVLILPAVKEKDDNPLDKRSIGDVLWDAKFGKAQVAATKASVGSREWNALYQQTPVAEEGNILKKDWFKYFIEAPQKFDEMIQSWDFATKDKATSDFTVGQVWGRIGANKYLLDQVRGRWSFPEACNQLVKLSIKYPKAYAKLVEAKANGPAVVQTLKAKVSGLIEVEPRGDKVARMNAVTPEFESGNVHFPSPQILPWVDDYVSELLAFPTGANDDQCDATSQALDRLRKSGPTMAPIAGHSG